jgi:anti-sigma factor (TIGR02949 family)
MTEETVSCRQALERLWALIDEELDTASEERVREHLAACSHCFPQFDFQKEFTEFLATRCRHDAPPELRSRILELLSSYDKC